MSTFTKEKLSGSTDGMGVNVAAIATAGTTIHTSSAIAGVVDELWIYASNNGAVSVKLTLEYGGAGVGDNIEIVIPGESGLVLIIPGLTLMGGKVLKAFAATTAVITLHGFVNRITP